MQRLEKNSLDVGLRMIRPDHIRYFLVDFSDRAVFFKLNICIKSDTIPILEILLPAVFHVDDGKYTVEMQVGVVRYILDNARYFKSYTNIDDF